MRPTLDTRTIRKPKSQWAEAWRRLKKDKAAMFGLIVLGLLVIAAIFADLIAPFPYDKQDLGNMFARPSWQHLFGTDNFGRDVLSRVIHGARISLMIGFISVFIGATIGGTLGALAAYYGGKIDIVIMRFVDIMLSMPNLLLAISLSAALGPGLFNAMLAVGISSVPTYARVVRASVMTVKNQEYVEAAHALGVKTKRMLLKHIIPNSLAPVIVQISLGVGGAILVAASLSFIGLGVQPPTPDWGGMLSAGRQFMRNHWHLVTFPGVAIMLTIAALNLLGDGLRDALDPRLRK